MVVLEVVVASVFLSKAAPKENLGRLVLVGAALVVVDVDVEADVVNENAGAAEPPSAGLLVRIEGVVAGLEVPKLKDVDVAGVDG